MIRSQDNFQSGWGLNFISSGTCTNDLNDIFSVNSEHKRRGVIPVGLGRSYGDSILNSGGLQFSSSNYRSLFINESTGVAECGSGVTIRQLEYQAHLLGFLPAIVPGTSFVTVGGAFASDIHGKSQSNDGNFSNHVRAITMLNEKGEENVYLPNSREFKATAGGMGLTGFITKLDIQLKKIDTSIIFQKQSRAYSLEQLLNIIEQFDSQYQYTVGWIDISGDFSGRGLVTGGRFAFEEELKNASNFNLGFNPTSEPIAVPFIPGINLINRLTIRIFNQLWFRKPLRDGLISFPKFMHPLDSISNWNKVYGKRGFIQYQFVIPEESREVLHLVLKILKENRVSSFLTVIKKFGKNGSGYLSFPMPGWTLAMDFSCSTKNISIVIRKLDDLISHTGGRIYLAKDSTSSPQAVKTMYENFETWKKIKREMDPDNFWQSDQARRLNLC